MPVLNQSQPTDSIWLRLTGWVIVAIGLLVVAGWLGSVRGLTTFGVNDSPMVMNAALSALAIGGGLVALGGGWRRSASMLGLAAALLGMTVLVQFFVGHPLGVDELFWKHQWVSLVGTPGRMAPNSALSFTLLGLSVAMAAFGKGRHWLLDLTCGVVISSALSPLFNEVTWLVFGSNHVGYRGLALPTFLVLTLPAPLLLLRLNSPVGPTHRADFQVMAVALGMLLPLGVTFVRSNAQLADINREQRRSFDTCAAISYLVSENARMESSARAYALTGEDSFLARHPYHRSEIMATLAKLPELTAGDPVQQDRVNRLHVLLGWRQAEYVSLEEARRSGGAESAARYLTNLPVSRKLAFVNLADGMLALERQRMVERTGAAIDLEHSTKTEQLLSGLLGLILLGTAVGSARRSETQLKRLESFLPICSYCKKIRNDGKYWEQIEAYFSERQGTRFTHGICPECYKREVMPELRSIGEQPAGPKNPEKHG